MSVLVVFLMYKTTLTHLNCKSTIGMNWELHPIKKIVCDYGNAFCDWFDFSVGDQNVNCFEE